MNTNKIEKINKELERYGKLKLTEQEAEILFNMILNEYTVEDFLYAKGRCLKEGWIEYK